MAETDNENLDAQVGDEWEKMINSTESANKDLNQDQIDDLLGFAKTTDTKAETTGIRAMLDKALMTYQRLPMLEIVFDRFAVALSTSLRNLTAENVDVDIRNITSMRYGDYIDAVPIPAIIATFKVIEWENYGLINADGSLVYSLVDVLFGGRKVQRPIRFEGRPFSQIEQYVMRKLVEVVLQDLGSAFEPLSLATFLPEKMETNPRFVSITRPGDAVILLELRVDMEERGGKLEILIPYSTLEPIRDLLLQVFMGEKFGKDSNWEIHLQTELNDTEVELEAVLPHKILSLGQVSKLDIGSTIVLDVKHDHDVILKCADVKILQGKLGKHADNIAIKVSKILNNTDKGII